jgi:hypothetical protein
MLDHEPIFGKNVIETLSEGMYDNPLFLFREYVQNSADSIDAAVRNNILRDGEGQIEIVIDSNKRIITFEDNGTGIPHHSVKSMLANIGDSQKDRLTDKGFRGIGRLGGLGYCQKVRFETSSKGEPIKSVLEWDARNLHEILANKDEKIHAGQLIKRITSTWEEECKTNEHFFKVTLLNVNDSSDELLDVEEVRKYLSMVAPVPFDYAKFPFIQKIEKFISDQNLQALHEYRLNLNGDEVRKGYETPLAIGDAKSIEIFDVVCRTVWADEKCLGWYWFCVSKFEGVLPKKCWQRNIRLRKANIQIGEADCLSNHPKRGDTLWREDRGNNYFIGEIHALDVDLIPNSRRDYFNQDEACRCFENAFQREFGNLHDLYHDASAIRSASFTIKAADAAKKEFETKDKKGAFYDKLERDKAAEKVSVAVEKAEVAQRTIAKFKEKVKSPLLYDGDSAAPISHLFDSYVEDTIIASAEQLKLDRYPRKGFAKDNIKQSVKNVLEIVFDVLKRKLPEEEATMLKDEIIKRFSPK